MILIWTVAGLVLLLWGAEWLVRGAVSLALRLGISGLMVGLTVVSFGTSAPELAIGITSILQGKTDLSVGNVVGSNIFNLLFVLGGSALIIPLMVARQLVRWDVPLLIGVTVLSYFMAKNLVVSSFEGGVLFLLAGAYTYMAIRLEKSDLAKEEPSETLTDQPKNLARPLFFMISGLILLLFGSHFLVEGSVALAALLGVSELVIGLTVVAMGTSLPEAATSFVAALRGQRDIAIGNVVGSSIFNLLVVLGVCAFIAPGGMPVSQVAIDFDFPMMLFACLICLPIFASGYVVSRLEGALLLGLFVLYLTRIILHAVESNVLALFDVALYAYGSILALYVLVGVARILKKSKNGMKV
jgi:cation:H+ antiporter